jgi:hypothetical protein
MDLAPNKKRYSCYRYFISQKYGAGALGKFNRIRIAFCVEEEINDWFPNIDGEPRTGFRPSLVEDNGNGSL